MILKNSYLNNIDNSGVLCSCVFHIYGGFFVKYAVCGNFLKISVRKVSFYSLVLKKSKIKCIFIHSAFFQKKNDGTNIFFKRNSCILLKRRLVSYGNEIYGPCINIIKRRRFIFSFSGLI